MRGGGADGRADHGKPRKAENETVRCLFGFDYGTTGATSSSTRVSGGDAPVLTPAGGGGLCRAHGAV